MIRYIDHNPSNFYQLTLEGRLKRPRGPLIEPFGKELAIPSTDVPSLIDPQVFFPLGFYIFGNTLYKNPSLSSDVFEPPIPLEFEDSIGQQNNGIYKPGAPFTMNLSKNFINFSENVLKRSRENTNGLDDIGIGKVFKTNTGGIKTKMNTTSFPSTSAFSGNSKLTLNSAIPPKVSISRTQDNFDINSENNESTV